MPAQTVIKLRRDTAANWTSANPTLAAGEAGFESDTNKLKIGNGTTAWNSLPYTGADVTNLDYIGFDTTAGVTVGVGQLAWNAEQETLDLGLDGAVTLQLGQEHVVRVKNASGTTAIPNGTFVMFAGAAGDTVTVAPAVTDGSVRHDYMVGVTTEEIPADGFGFVTQFGMVNEVDTAVWPVGTILYPDPTTAGNFTATEPVAPNLKLPIAAVVKQGAGTSGKLLVRMDVGATLSDLHSVQITSGTAGQFLKYDGTKWINDNIATDNVTGLVSALDSKLTATITDPATGQVIQYDGANWVNATPAAGGEAISSFLLMGA